MRAGESPGFAAPRFQKHLLLRQPVVALIMPFHAKSPSLGGCVAAGHDL